MSSSNPFAKFNARPSSQTKIGAWLTTKKTGRDDDKITRDRKKAELARKKARPVPNRKKKRQIQSDSDDEGSIDNFIVDDDEIEEVDSSDEEEELVFVDSRKRKASKQAATKTLPKKKSREQTFTYESSEDDSSSEIDEPAFFKPIQNITGKSPNQVKNSLHIVANSTSSNDSYSSLTHLSKPQKKKITSSYFKNSEEKKEDANRKNPFDDESDFFDDEELAVSLAKKKSLKENPRKQKLQKQTKKTSHLQKQYIRSNEEQDIKDAIEASLQEAKKDSKKKKRHIIEESDSDSDVEPEKNHTSIHKPIYKEEYESHSEENYEDNVEEDEYQSSDSKKAESILETTTNLSSEILSRMSQWCDDTKSSEQTSGSVSAKTTGMIVDGALSLSLCNAEKHKLLVQRESVESICHGLKLADYQLLGVNWMAFLNGMSCSIDQSKIDNSKANMNVNGVLADEMGLGKTVQTIAFLAWLKYRNKPLNSSVESAHHSPHIIIVPASVLSNWQNEFKKFCPDMTVVKYHGTMNERVEIQNHLRKCLPSSPNRLPLDVVLTTFSYFSSEKSDDRSFLRKFKFDYMVVDEAHCLKNAKGLRYRNMDKFSTKRRLLLTGTPVQNSPKELLSLLCFLMPLFSQKSNNDDGKENNGGEHMLEHFVSMDKDASEEHAYRKLKQLLSPFVLRRKKSDVLSQLLPPKTKRLELVPFDEKTRKVYESIISNHVANRQGNMENESYRETKHIFTSLRKAANHPLLLRTRHTSPEDVAHLSYHLLTSGFFGTDATCTLKLVQNELKQFSDFDIHCTALDLISENPEISKELEKYTLKEDDMFCSPKFTRLKTLLPELVAENHRILLFSQWTKCLDLLECLMESINFKYRRLDGQTSISERQTLIDEFNGDPSIPVFLLSTRAGGMGINLTAADTCILHDLDFNPFNDLQAEDRCHRIGQKRPVTVIKMVTADTVDASIYSMQERKAKMNAAILENNDNENIPKDNKNQRTKMSGKKSNKQDEIAMNTIVQDAMTQYLSSTPKKNKNRA